jgi:hypothetical protein
VVAGRRPWPPLGWRMPTPSGWGWLPVSTFFLFFLFFYFFLMDKCCFLIGCGVTPLKGKRRRFEVR